MSTVAPGDTVYVGAGSYYELMTIATSGSVGNPITWIGDYAGAFTGDAGVVRVTGAATNNQTHSRAECVIATSKDYNTFRGFVFDGHTNSGNAVWLTSCVGWIIEQCCLQCGQLNGLGSYGASQASLTVRNCVFYGNQSYMLLFTHSSTVSNAGHVVQSCIFVGGYGASSLRVGGITFSNCHHMGCTKGVAVEAALAVGQTVTVNNGTFYGCGTALQATTTAEFSEDYNNIISCTTARSNVTAGGNSKAYLWLPDWRWAFEMFKGGTVTAPFDPASYSPLVELSSGTGAPSTDIRGHAVEGSFREWGPAEYVSTYGVGGAGGIVVSPLGQQIIQALLGGSQ